MENETPLTEHESLRIIQEMITAAKNDVKADAFIFLLWGYLVLIASITQFILLTLNVDHNGTPWLLMPLGGLITIIYVIRKNKKIRTKTHVSEFLKFIWIAFGVALGILMFCTTIPVLQMMPLIMMLYGVGLFLSGGALKFKPLIAGGIFCWICAIAGFEIQSIYQLLILALAVLGGYVIPGHLLQFNNRNTNV